MGRMLKYETSVQVAHGIIRKKIVVSQEGQTCTALFENVSNQKTSMDQKPSALGS